MLSLQRKVWMWAGVFFLGYLSFLAYDWYTGNVDDHPIFWISSGVVVGIVSIVWWVWTMLVLKKMIDSKIDEITLLAVIIEEVKLVKTDIQQIKKSIDS